MGMIDEVIDDALKLNLLVWPLFIKLHRFHVCNSTIHHLSFGHKYF